jgi:hypothetical protein
MYRTNILKDLFQRQFENSDAVGSCQFLIDRSNRVNTFKEISIVTGKQHGAFYNPLPEWVVPVKNWIKSTSSKQI